MNGQGGTAASPALLSVAHKLAMTLCGIVIAMSLRVLLGWALGSPWPVRDYSDTTTPITVPPAVCFILISLAIIASTRTSVRAQRVINVLSVATGTLALPTIAYAIRSARHDVDPAPWGLSPLTGLAVIAIVVSIQLTQHGKHLLSQRLTALPFTICMAAAVATAFQMRSVLSDVPGIGVSMPSALGILLCLFAMACLNVNRGPVRIFAGRGAGGRAARWLMPLTVSMPVGVSALMLHSLSTKALTPAQGMFFMALIGMVAMGAMMWYLIETIDAVAVQRDSAAQALQRAQESEQRRRRLATEKRGADERTEALLDSALDAFITLDSQGVVTSWNQAATGLYGWSRAEAMGSRLQDLITVLDDHEKPLDIDINGEWLDLRAEEQTAHTYDVVAKLGIRRRVESRVWAYDWPEGRRWTVIVRDVGQRDEVLTRISELDRDLNQFSAMAANDLHGPLSAAMDDLDSLRARLQDSGDTEGLSLADRSHEAARRGVELLEGLLDYAHVGEIDARSVVELSTICRETFAEIAGREGRGHLMMGDLPDVRGDARSLRLVLNNLFTNSLRFCPADREPRVRVDSTIEADTHWVTIRVTDNGTSIPATEREEVFRMLRRGTGPGVGGGVGLAVCRRIITRHGGHIWVDDAPGRGTRICFTLQMV